MHAIPALILLVALVCCAGAADSEDYPKFYSSLSAGAEAAFAEEAKADFSIFYDYDGKLDIGIGLVRDGARRPVAFTFDELRSFWEEQRHKTFIVVTLSKVRRPEIEAKKLIARITDYFFSCGFQRVRIHQAYATGVGVLFDSRIQKRNGKGSSK